MRTDIMRSEIMGQPHHTPIKREEVVTKDDNTSKVTKEEDIAECFGKLTLDQKSMPPKTNHIIKSEIKKDTALKAVKDIKVEPKDDESEAPKTSMGSSPEEEDSKECAKPTEDEKPKEEQPLGELCSRGPDRKAVDSWSKSMIAPYPSIPHPLRNHSLTNGGEMIYNVPQTQLTPEICYPHSSICHNQEPLLECYPIHSPSVPNDHSHFISNINNYPLEVSECPEIQQHALSPAKPETPREIDLGLEDDLAIVLNVLECEESRKSVVRDLQSYGETINVPSESQNYFETQIDQSPCSSYGNISPESSPQVVPGQSPYSSSYDSPPGPSSYNLYANIPNYSPEMPSPRGYLSDDSSTHMYPSSKPSMTNQVYYAPEPWNLDEIVEKKKGLEEKEVVQELDTTCSKACSTTLTFNPPPSLSDSNVPLSVTSVAIKKKGAAASPSIRPTITSGSNLGITQYRKILPKPSDDIKSTQHAESIHSQNITPRQRVDSNGMINSQRKCALTAREQLRARCSPKRTEQTWIKVNARTNEEISETDKDGDTSLMIIVCDTQLEHYSEKLYAMVERCKLIPQVLRARNKDGHSALYMASLIVKDDPLVAKYLAETMIELGEDLNELYEDGSTLIHVLCKQGDDWAQVLNQLLTLHDKTGKRCFDIDKSDFEGRTPLHVAVIYHRNVPSLQTVKVLLKHGADLGIKDGKQGFTPLHFALATEEPDPNLIKILCSAAKKDLVNSTNYKGDTPLHVAMAFGGNVEENTLNCIIECLMASGASRAIRNQNGKAPLELAPESRKVEIKKILDQYNIK